MVTLTSRDWVALDSSAVMLADDEFGVDAVGIPLLLDADGRACNMPSGLSRAMLAVVSGRSATEPCGGVDRVPRTADGLAEELVVRAAAVERCSTASLLR